MPQYYLAIDIGASSGRHILGWIDNGKLCLEEVYRFENRQVVRNGHDCWDIDHLWQGVLEGLKQCGALGKIPKTISVDTWGVDFVLLDSAGAPVGDFVAYRDKRNQNMDKLVEAVIPPQTLYQRTGIQKAVFNTIYQLTALQQTHPEQLERAESLLFTPDYLQYRLTGVKKTEYTIASTSNLLHAERKTWDEEILRRLGLPERIFGPISMPGETVGPLLPEIAEAVGYNATVILGPSHDTASAFLAVPAQDEHAVYLSSGTWSLLGVENPVPVTTEESRLQNFTNEGGAWYRYRYLKNIMGLWMLQSIRRELNGTTYVQGKENRSKSARQWSFRELTEAAESAADFDSVVDVNADIFLAPDSMMQTIRDECARTGQKVPETVGEILQCVYNSLSLCYRDTIRTLETLTGNRYTSINIVGGGCQDLYLNRKTAMATGLPVLAGPVEGTAIGNLILQMITAGAVADLAAARSMIRESFPVQTLSV